jgi:hypothetical protein
MVKWSADPPTTKPAPPARERISVVAAPACDPVGCLSPRPALLPSNHHHTPSHLWQRQTLPTGWLKLLGPVFTWVGRRQNQRDVERLRDILEAAPEQEG